MLVGPVLSAITTERVVEPPGIAPGSGPLITSAFIAIVRADPDGFSIGVPGQSSKGRPAPGRFRLDPDSPTCVL